MRLALRYFVIVTSVLRLVPKTGAVPQREELGVYVASDIVSVYNSIKANRISFEFDIIRWEGEVDALLDPIGVLVENLKAIDFTSTGNPGGLLSKLIAKVGYEYSELVTALVAISNYRVPEETGKIKLKRNTHIEVTYLTTVKSLQIFQANFETAYSIAPLDSGTEGLSDVKTNKYRNFMLSLDTQISLLRAIRAEAELTQKILHNLTNGKVIFELFSILHRYEGLKADKERDIIRLSSCDFKAKKVECAVYIKTLYEKSEFKSLVPVPYQGISLDTTHIFTDLDEATLYYIVCKDSEPVLNHCQVDEYEGDCPNQIIRTDAELQDIFTYCPIKRNLDKTPTLLPKGILVPIPSLYEFYQIYADGGTSALPYSSFQKPIIINSAKPIQINSTWNSFTFLETSARGYILPSIFSLEEINRLPGFAMLATAAFINQNYALIVCVLLISGSIIIAAVLISCIIKCCPRRKSRRTKPKELHKFLKDDKKKETEKSPRHSTETVSRLSKQRKSHYR